jgi:hypothetical protein
MLEKRCIKREQRDILIDWSNMTFNLLDDKRAKVSALNSKKI